MNIKALRAFRAIVTEGSVVGASRAMNLSQPAVSRLLALLEAELRLPLFHRVRRRMILTEEGRAFVREAGRILANLDEIPRIADEIRSSRVKRLRVVTMPRAALSVVCPAVANLTREHPDVEISLDLRTRRDLELWIGGKEYDIGFGNVPVLHPSVRSIPLVRVRLELLLPVGHPLSRRERLTVEDLAGEAVIAQFPGLLLRKQMDELFHASEMHISYRLQTSSSQMASHLVANGAGVTIIDRLSAATLDPREVVLRPLDPERWVSFGVILPKNDETEPLTELMIEYLRREIDDQLVPGIVERPRDPRAVAAGGD
jgi:DNA-binding transcriptional LysR family regulator